MGKRGREQHIKDPLKVSFPRFTKGKKNRDTVKPRAPVKGKFPGVEAQEPHELSSRVILRKSEHGKAPEAHEEGIATLKTEPGLHQLCQEGWAGRRIPWVTAKTWIEGHLPFSCPHRDSEFPHPKCTGIHPGEKSAKVSRV